jgi:UDP-N-acetylmuramoyl-L-alanyl-D-glutamate--2,6-diaminopimelate ligase
MYLNEIIQEAPAIEIKNLMSDSRKKTRNSLFFCVKGRVYDGHRFVDEAIENGAVAIIHSDELENQQDDVVYIQVKDVLKTLNQVANTFYGKPSSKLEIYGVTGTNGKSTVATLINHFNQQTQVSGYIGTICIDYANQKFPALLTTPDILDLHRSLNDMVQAKVESVSLEVSSIGLEQRRIDSVAFNVGIFTNLTHDHLDYHGTMENYFIAKARLFELLPKEGYAIINLDDSYGKRIIEYTSAHVITYGENQNADYVIKNIQLESKQSMFTIHNSTTKESIDITTNLVAKFNVYNLVAALVAVSVKRNIPLLVLADYCLDIPQIEGRMEIIESDNDFTTIVDFAHTPDGFIQCFEYAKSITDPQHRIIVVFGSAGKRDTKKRHVLGEIANNYCDMIILTEEDQRDEDVFEICNQIKAGIDKANYIVLIDRTNAIRQAIMIANSNDTVFILGKGDETYLDKEFGKEYYKGDHKVAKEALEERIKKNEEENNESVY